jgi:ectoine hydroxylase-related dioxygenase (phytanoyl-CoA dioxygenase family)
LRISTENLDHFRTHGYCVVEGFLTREKITAAHQQMLTYFPSAEELAATPQRYGGILEDPEHLQVEFPFDDGILNDISTHPHLIATVEKLLGTSDILLSQSAIWAKYAGTGDFEQGMHLDYQGNTLVVPRDDGAYPQINMILYYTDVTADLGPTCVVSKKDSADRPLWPAFRTRKKDAELYRIEKQIIAPAGSLLLFTMSTWHRASAMTADFGVRFSHHMVWRAAKYGFQGYHQWSHFGEKPQMQQFIERASPRQREVLGFPPPRHEYWNEQTLAAAAMRYPKMDLGPYRSQI